MANQDIFSKSDLVEAVRLKANFTKLEAEKAINFVFETIQEQVKEDKSIQIRDFGVFSLVHQAAYTARNPRTGEPVQVPDRVNIKFKPSKNLKAYLNNAEISDDEIEAESTED
jgi:nucleoid DNA-binding protein